MQERIIRLPSGWLFVPVFLLLAPGAIAALIYLAAQDHAFLAVGASLPFSPAWSGSLVRWASW